jgi:sugar lactone lactonase YvrE
MNPASLGRECRAAVVLASVTFGGLGIPGCSSSDSAGPAGQGSLSVTITVPQGATPSVVVRGPEDYQQAVMTSEILSGLTPGSYTVTALPVTGVSSIVPASYGATVTGSSFTVKAGDTATVRVVYTAERGTGALWVANYGREAPLVGYTAPQLETSMSAPPAIVIAAWPELTTGQLSVAAFDAHGNLWALSDLTGTVLEFTADQLASSGIITPAVVLSVSEGTIYPLISGLAFDASGSLWVARSNGTIVQFASSELAISGAPTPNVTLTIDATGLAFDSSDNLWLTASNKVMMLAASQLAADGSPAPTVTLNDVAGSGSSHGTRDLAFDAAGNLWASITLDNKLVEFSRGQLAVSGSPVPAVTLSSTGATLSDPRGLAFDVSGNLWVANWTGDAVVEFTASQLTSSGAPVPNVIVRNSSSVFRGPSGLAFNPHAPNLPLR